MFEFLLALLGGSYYGSKALSDRDKVRKFDKMSEQQATLRQNLRDTICADYHMEKSVKDYISSGEHFDDICGEFESEFKDIFGNEWKDKIRIPPKAPVLNPDIYKDDAYSFSVPANHIYWVYRIILATVGKVDDGLIAFGYSISYPDRDMCIKFAKAIERRLVNAGVSEVRLVLEYQSENDPCGVFKIESICGKDTYRLW